MLPDNTGRPIRPPTVNRLGFGVRKQNTLIDLTQQESPFRASKNSATRIPTHEYDSDSDSDDQAPSLAERRHHNHGYGSHEQEDDDTAPPVVLLDESDTDDDAIDENEVTVLGVYSRARTETPTLPGRGYLESFTNSYGIRLTPGSNWDVSEDEFFRILTITRHRSGEVVINGRRFRRNRAVNNMLPKLRNEVAAVLQVPEDVASPGIWDYLERIGPDELLISRDIFICNYPCVKLSSYEPLRADDRSFRDSFQQKYPGKNVVQMRRYIEDHERLVCRVKFIQYCDKMGKLLVKQGAILAVTENECDPNFSTSDVFKTRNWHGTYEELEGCVSDQGNTTPAQPEASSLPEITFGDGCCGAGGWTRGATRAGLKPNWLLDCWKTACDTAALNWPDARILRWDIFKFCTRTARRWMRVVVLHLSFPCQMYSPAKTCAGQNDDANSAAGFSVIELLQKSRPRIVTLEQTSGLIERHPEPFSAMIHQFTHMNYSIRWKIIKADDQGGYQRRKRLIMVASCPGEPLPPFPKATHGPVGSGLKPYTTVREALWRARGYIDAHMAEFTPLDKEPYNSDRPLAHTITCGGGKGDIHPSGTRTFNCLELAILQGFERFHKFVNTCKTELRTMIGNAVPSMVSEAVNKEVVSSIRKRDREIAAYRPEVIALDD